MATVDAYVAVLESWLAQGIHEDPPQSNDTPIGAEFGWNGVAWCCETCSVAQERVGLHCFHTASVAEAINEAKQGLRGMTWIPRDGHIQRGDLVTFDWGGHGNPQDFHIGSVVDPGTQAKFQTIAGNENDAVMRQWRDRTYVQGFIRLPFDQPAPAPSPTPEDDMPYIVKCQDEKHSTAQYLVMGPHVILIRNPAELAQVLDDKLQTYAFPSFVFDDIVKHVGE